MPATSALACLEKAAATLAAPLGFASAFGFESFDGQSGSQCVPSHAVPAVAVAADLEHASVLALCQEGEREQNPLEGHRVYPNVVPTHIVEMGARSGAHTM